MVHIIDKKTKTHQCLCIDDRQSGFSDIETNGNFKSIRRVTVETTKQRTSVVLPPGIQWSTNIITILYCYTYCIVMMFVHLTNLKTKIKSINFKCYIMFWKAANLSTVVQYF